MNFRSELSSRNKSIFFWYCLCLGEQQAGNELSSAHEVELVKSMINGALCWHLHRVIYGSLIEVKRRLVATAGEAAPDLCGCASEQPTGCSGEMKRQPSLAHCCFPSCLLWREMKTIPFAGMDEGGRWGVRWRHPQFQTSASLSTLRRSVSYPGVTDRLLLPLMVVSIGRHLSFRSHFIFLYWRSDRILPPLVWRCIFYTQGRCSCFLAGCRT